MTVTTALHLADAVEARYDRRNATDARTVRSARQRRAEDRARRQGTAAA